MSITFNANQTPAIQLAGTLGTKSAAAASSNGTAPTSPNYTPGESNLVASKLNVVSQALDNMASFGGGSIYAIGYGLTLTSGPGLTVNVAPGQASMLGTPEVATAITGVALANNATNYIWLIQYASGVVPGVGIHVQQSTAVPSLGIARLFLGVVVTSGGTAGTPDTTAVMLATGGGFRFRETNDAGIPTDSPPVGCPPFFTFTNAGGVYIWSPIGNFYTIYSAPGTLPFTIQPCDATGANTGAAVTGNILKFPGFTVTASGSTITLTPVGATDTNGG